MVLTLEVSFIISAVSFCLIILCSNVDPSMFISRTSSHTLILLLYIDDIILTGSPSTIIQSFIGIFFHQFAMKDLR